MTTSEIEPPVPPPVPPPVATYRYLRVALVVLAVVLAVSVGLEATTGDDGLLDSISAYYYTPVRDVFVGVLAAMGLGLVAVRGRDERGEDVMLNLAGMLAPVVAVVPTPLDGEVPAAYVAGVDDAALTLLVAGTVGLAIGWVAAWRRGRAQGRVRRTTLLGLLAATVVVAGGGLALALAHQVFLDVAHYVAAITMFLLMVAVAGVNALATRHRARLRGRELGFRGLYAAVALAMLAVVVLAVVLSVLDTGGPWLLVLEASLLALFAVFWVAQTAEFWREGQ